MSNAARRLPQRLVCRSSAEWVDYFRANWHRSRPIPWDEGVALSAQERAAVIRSIQVFQLGESGEGKHFLCVAKWYAERSGDHDYLDALQMFLAEEHRHAGELGRVLDLAGEPRLRKEWTDHVFRWLRHRAGLELVITVLLTAEILAQVYYAALRRATRSTLLVRLWEQILADEAAHVRFQAERLALLRRGRGRIALRVKTMFERILFAGTCLAVWRGHRPVFRAAQISFRSFWRQAHTAFKRSLHLRDPANYISLGRPSRSNTATSPAVAAAFPSSTQDVYS